MRVLMKFGASAATECSALPRRSQISGAWGSGWEMSPGDAAAPEPISASAATAGQHEDVGVR
jgi:hypothetical protein